MFGILLRAEHDLAVQLANLKGHGVIETAEHVRDLAASFDSTIVHHGERTYDPVTGSIAVGQDMLGEEHRLQLHDPDEGGVDNVFILGNQQCGKSGSLRTLIFQAAISGVFRIFPADPRNEHNFPDTWELIVDTPAWIATNVSDALRNLEAMSRVIAARSAAEDCTRPARGHPGIFFALDDADDILAHPRGQRLIERIVNDGPAVCVGLIAVIRSVDSLMGNETLLRAVANSRNKLFFGSDGAEVLEKVETAYGT